MHVRHKDAEELTRRPPACVPGGSCTAPALRVVAIFPAVTLNAVAANDVGSTGWVFDFGSNFAGMSRLTLPAGHGLPAGAHVTLAMSRMLSCTHDAGGLEACGPLPWVPLPWVLWCEFACTPPLAAAPFAASWSWSWSRRAWRRVEMPGPFALCPWPLC